MDVGDRADREPASPEITLQEIIDGVEDQLLVVDRNHRLVFVNEAVRLALAHEDRAPIPGEYCYVALQGRTSPCASPLWDCPLRKTVEAGRTTTLLHPMLVDGAEIYLKVSAFPLQNEDGEVVAVVELRRDVTAERRLETELLHRHHSLLALHHISRAISGLMDLDAILLSALDNVLEIIDGTMGGILLLDEATEALSYRVHRGLSAGFASQMRIPVGQGVTGLVAQTGEPIFGDDLSKDPRAVRTDLLSAEGVRGFASIPLTTKGKVVGVLNVLSHTPGRFGPDEVVLLSSVGDFLGTAIAQSRLYMQVRRQRERYRALLRHALTAQEEERERIARELHDETSQALTSLSLNLQAVIAMAEMKGIDDQELMDRLKMVHSRTVHAGNEIVRLMKELRPTLLDELGLPAAINRYARDSLEPRGVEVATEFAGMDQRIRPEVEVTLFRVAQGAIGNILKHSGATRATVRVDCDDTECVLRVSDDGRGFDVSQIQGVDPVRGGAGVFTMKERVRLVGGRCKILSRPGEGTTVEARVPLLKDLADEANSRTDR